MGGEDRGVAVGEHGEVVAFDVAEGEEEVFPAVGEEGLAGEGAGAAETEDGEGEIEEGEEEVVGEGLEGGDGEVVGGEEGGEGRCAGDAEGEDLSV